MFTHPVHPSTPLARAAVRGKFLWVGDEKLFVRGVTYGTFAPGPDGAQFPSRERVEQDLAGMAASGFNTVRTYTVPPRWLLDLAHRHGLRVMVGHPWEQHDALRHRRRRPRRRRRRRRGGGGRPRGRARVRGPPRAALPRDRQRDPRVDRPLARP